MPYKYEFKTQPYEHQKSAIRSGWGKRAFAYLMEMGTGKTKVAIDEIAMLYETGNIDAALIIAPKGVYMNWVNTEIPTHLPDRVAAVTRSLEWRSGGGGVYHRRDLNQLLQPSPGLAIVTMNTEALSTGRKALDYAEKFLETYRCYVVVDESTFIKNHSSKRTKNIVSLGKSAEYRRIMTGSPVTRSPLDLYSQFDFLGRGLLGSTSYYAFRARYSIMQNMNFGGRKVPVVVGHKNLDDLTERLKPHSYRVTKDECLDLPDKIYTRRDVELTKEQQRMYDQMLHFAIAEFSESDEFVSASNAITKIMRLHQITCGHTVDDNGDAYDIPSNRLAALEEITEETDGKIIIWSRYRRDISKIVEMLEKKYGERSVAEYHGGNTGVRSEEAARFKSDPECRFMVSNTQSGGYGNTWTEASTVVYYSNDFDLEKRIQSEDRAHRVGQTQHVTYIDLVAPGTVDEKILKALRSKIDIASAITQDGYREWLI